MRRCYTRRATFGTYPTIHSDSQKIRHQVLHCQNPDQKLPSPPRRIQQTAGAGTVCLVREEAEVQEAVQLQEHQLALLGRVEWAVGG